ncbi:MAG TPA: hypothetical protein VNI01_01080 [Elusimicrobiota bacterium]|jgi:hypothetical protein|nr:hypothetical protein [Elusimicrobiota bacterium]
MRRLLASALCAALALGAIPAQAGSGLVRGRGVEAAPFTFGGAPAADLPAAANLGAALAPLQLLSDPAAHPELFERSESGLLLPRAGIAAPTFEELVAAHANAAPSAAVEHPDAGRDRADAALLASLGIPLLPGTKILELPSTDEAPAGTKPEGPRVIPSTGLQLRKVLRALEGVDGVTAAKILQELYGGPLVRSNADPATPAGELVLPESMLVVPKTEPIYVVSANGIPERSPAPAAPAVPKAERPSRFALYGVLASAALSSLIIAALSQTPIPYGSAVKAMVWAANVLLAAFPLMAIVQVFRKVSELRRLRREGGKEDAAVHWLEGYDHPSHSIKMLAKGFQFGGIASKGVLQLWVLALTRVALSSFVLLQLWLARGKAPRRERILSSVRFAAVLLGVGGLLAFHFFVGPSLPFVVMILGMIGALLHSFFSVPKVFFNNKLLAKIRSFDPKRFDEQALAAMHKFRSNDFVYYLMVAFGNLFLVPAYLSTGLWYNALDCLFLAMVTSLLFYQMHVAGSLPWQRNAIRAGPADGPASR